MIEQDRELVAALRAGDEAAFSSLVDRYHASMVRVAQGYVRDAAIAEEVVQEAWLGILRGVAGYEGRSSLRTWIFSIVANKAKSKAMRENRTIPFSSLVEAGQHAPTVEPERFRPSDDPNWPGWWREYPLDWAELPEARLMAIETRMVIERAIDGLSDGQRLVITLRDIEGLTAPEVCSVLGLTETNQRVLLHRARSAVRKILERYFEEERG